METECQWSSSRFITTMFPLWEKLEKRYETVDVLPEDQDAETEAKVEVCLDAVRKVAEMTLDVTSARDNFPLAELLG